MCTAEYGFVQRPIYGFGLVGSVYSARGKLLTESVQAPIEFNNFVRLTFSVVGFRVFYRWLVRSFFLLSL
jgi:hypothetical protein